MSKLHKQSVALAVVALAPIPLYFAARAGAGALAAALLGLIALAMLAALLIR
ncbi:MAG: hypothetical protein HY784_03245 [Chloroflexi bacterium]|nr:hypothetical protein [Chloroflexota bacterium]